MKFSALLSFSALVSAATALPKFQSAYESDYKTLKDRRRGDSVLERLREDQRFSRFVQVVEKDRGLRDDLESSEKLTVFVPVDNAFDNAEKEFGKMNEKQWHDIVKYHVAGEAEITRDCLHAGSLIPTNLKLRSLENRHQRIRVFTFASKIWLNMRAVVHDDIEASNGIIYALDNVLTPPETIMDSLYAVPTTFSMTLAGLERTGLADQIDKESGITIFTPSNAAWKALGYENLRHLFSCVGQEKEESRNDKGEKHRRSQCQGVRDLKAILQNHVATDLVYSTDIINKERVSLKTLGREKLEVCAKQTGEEGRDEGSGHKDVRQYTFSLNKGEARIQFTDGLASNGALMVIDNVITKGVKLPHDRFMEI